MTDESIKLIDRPGGMILTSENLSACRKTHHIVILSTTNPTWVSLGLDPDLHGEELEANYLSHGADHSCSASQEIHTQKNQWILS
jgi:hypothetical protein